MRFLLAQLASVKWNSARLTSLANLNKTFHENKVFYLRDIWIFYCCPIRDLIFIAVRSKLPRFRDPNQNRAYLCWEHLQLLRVYQSRYFPFTLVNRQRTTHTANLLHSTGFEPVTWLSLKSRSFLILEAPIWSTCEPASRLLAILTVSWVQPLSKIVLIYLLRIIASV